MNITSNSLFYIGAILAAIAVIWSLVRGWKQDTAAHSIAERLQREQRSKRA